MIFFALNILDFSVTFKKSHITNFVMHNNIIPDHFSHLKKKIIYFTLLNAYARTQNNAHHNTIFI